MTRCDGMATVSPDMSSSANGAGPDPLVDQGYASPLPRCMATIIIMPPWRMPSRVVAIVASLRRNAIT